MKKASLPMRSSLVGEAVKVQDGVWMGPVFCEEGQIQAYIKLLPKRKLLTECLTAMLGRAHDLPVPRPHIVSIQDSSLLPQCPYPGWSGWAFGSSASTSPSLERVTKDEETAKRLLSGWKRAIEGAVFDCLIANEDRTRKNILWSDGPDGVGLIDHDDALPGWVMHDARSETKNALLEILCSGDDDLNRYRRRHQSLTAAVPYGSTDWNSFGHDDPWVRLFSSPEEMMLLLNYVLNRVNHLPYLLERATGARQQQVPYVGGLITNPVGAA